MNEIIVKEQPKVEIMIYEIRGKQVTLDSKISWTKCHYYFYDLMITYYNIDELLLWNYIKLDWSLIYDRNTRKKF